MWTPLRKSIAGSRRMVRTRGGGGLSLTGPCMTSARIPRADIALDIGQVFEPVRDQRFTALTVAGPVYSRPRIAGGGVFYRKGL